MIDFTPLVHQLARTPLKLWARDIQQQFDALYAIGHGDLPRWQAAVDALPDLQPSSREISTEFRIDGPCTDVQREQLRTALQGLIPWRKGPFRFFDVHVDTEWRSDWKWDRVSPHLDLTDKRILDVGCGNGYYMWRMLGAGAKTVVGIDPNWLFFCQFLAARRYLDSSAVWHLPIGIEDLPAKLEGFDTVFSMGVLYHRRSPIDHLLELKDCLVRGGELVLETLVIEGNANHVLVPEDRYAKMRNVWFLPSVAALELWLRRAGFTDIRCVDISYTTTDEQRATDWMKYQSLADFLDPDDPQKTVEGLPAPMRAVLVARKP